MMGVNASENTTFISERGSVVLVFHGICQNSTLYCTLFLTAYGILIIAGIILNLLVCVVMVTSKRHIKSTSCFMITHLCIVEIFYRVAVTPPMVLVTLPSSGNPFACKATYFISSTCRAALFGSLAVIAIDRYRNIVHPLDNLKRSSSRLRLLVTVWLYGIISSAMFIYTADQVPLDELPEGKISNGHHDDDLTACDVKPNIIGGISVTVSMVMTFIVPLTTIVGTYTAIFVSLRHRCRRGLVNKSAAKSKSKAAKMLVIVVSGFVICWGPGVAMETIRSYGGLDNTSVGVLVASSLTVNLLVLCSSLVNPAIYAFYSSGFKQDLIKIICSITCSSKQKLTKRATDESQKSQDTAM